MNTEMDCVETVRAALRDSDACAGNRLWASVCLCAAIVLLGIATLAGEARAQFGPQFTLGCSPGGTMALAVQNRRVSDERVKLGLSWQVRHRL